MLTVTRQLLEAALCKESLFDFVQRFWTTIIPEKPVWNWHIEYICHELQKVAERVFLRQPKEYDLIINVSPGSTKSTICSVMFPAWCWTREQTFRTICGSYAFPLSQHLASQTYRVLDSDKFREIFPEVKLARESMGLMTTEAGGQRICTSTGGSITGMHGHIIIIDDPINPKEAISEVSLKSANEWFDHTLLSRMIDKNITPVILIMQRLHQNDPTGHQLLKGEKAPIRHICLPAKKSDDIRPRSLRNNYVDGLFDPVRLPLKVLERAEAEMGTYAFAGQYQQTPIPMGNSMFVTSQIQILNSPPPLKKTMRYWDKAGCFLKGTLVATDRGNTPIEDIRIGDRVLTRQGYQEVEWAGVTKQVSELTTVLFSDGSLLTGTADHRIWTSNRNWVELASLKSFDRVVTATSREVVTPSIPFRHIESVPVDVYDLTVRNSHEFFANGILVHNSAGKGCWTVGVKMGITTTKEFVILDVVRGQWEASEREKIIKQTAIIDGKGVYIGIEQEPGSGGKESAQMTLKNLAGYRVKLDRPVGDKALRADPYAVQVNGGNVRLVRGVWNQQYLAELQYFPFSTYCDQVDASSGVFAMLTGRIMIVGGL